MSPGSSTKSIGRKLARGSASTSGRRRRAKWRARANSDANGRLLHPDTAATPIDRYFAARSFYRTDVTGVVHTTTATPDERYPAHVYMLAAKQTVGFEFLLSVLTQHLVNNVSAGTAVCHQKRF